jgi:spore maturation protein SpmA
MINNAHTDQPAAKLAASVATTPGALGVILSGNLMATVMGLGYAATGAVLGSSPG